MIRSLLRLAAPGVLACAIASIPLPARANLLVNGSFESGPSPGALLPLVPSSIAVSGWEVTRAGVDYAGTAWTAAHGARSIALNGPAAGGIQQTFATLPNAIYTVRFYLAGDPETLPDIKTMRVAAAGASAAFTADITGMWAWDPGWNPNVWSFRATSTSTTLEFYSDMPGPTGATLDSVTVELTSTADVAAGAAGLAFAPIAPHPVRGPARLAFTLPQAGPARLALYDVSGREVARIADGELAAGSHEFVWREAGAHPAGLYFAELRAAGARLVRSLVLVH